MKKRSLLKSVFVFSGLEDALLAQLTDQLKEARFGAGESVFREKVPADSFFIVESGEVVITKELAPGQEKVLAVLGPGSVFGEMAFFSDSPRTANAAARADTLLWKVERSAFMEFIARQPAAGLRILSGLLQVTMDRLEQTSRELATIYQTGKIISAGKRLADVAAGVQEEILLAIPEAKRAATFLYNAFNDEYDPAAPAPGMKEIAPNHPLLARLKEKMSGVVVDTARVQGLEALPFLAGARFVLTVPILKKEALIGFILLWNDAAANVFKSGHSLLVSSVAGQLAEAIENMRYQQEERDRQRLNNAKQRY